MIRQMVGENRRVSRVSAIDLRILRLMNTMLRTALTLAGLLLSAFGFATGTAVAASGEFVYSTGLNDNQVIANPQNGLCIDLVRVAAPNSPIQNGTDATALMYATEDCSGTPYPISAGQTVTPEFEFVAVQFYP